MSETRTMDANFTRHKDTKEKYIQTKMHQLPLNHEYTKEQKQMKNKTECKII